MSVAATSGPLLEPEPERNTEMRGGALVSLLERKTDFYKKMCGGLNECSVRFVTNNHHCKL